MHTSQDAKTSFCFLVSNHLVRHLNAFQILLKTSTSTITSSCQNAQKRTDGEGSGKVKEEAEQSGTPGGGSSWVSPVEPWCHDAQTWFGAFHCLTVGFWFACWMEKHCKDAPYTLLLNLKVYKVKIPWLKITEYFSVLIKINYISILNCLFFHPGKFNIAFK